MTDKVRLDIDLFVHSDKLIFAFVLGRKIHFVY